MPRLGAGEVDENSLPRDPLFSGTSSSHHRREAAAYANHHNPLRLSSLRNLMSGSGFLTVLSVIALLVVLQNVLFRNYRQEALQELQAGGKIFSEQELERLIPKTAAERRQSVQDQKNDLGQLKQEVALLRGEIHEIRQYILDSGGNISVTRSNDTASFPTRSQQLTP